MSNIKNIKAVQATANPYGILESRNIITNVSEVVTSYPTTNANKAGTRFFYRGNEWHYMTQEEIDATGWTGLVSVGFPAPLRKVFDPSVLFETPLPLPFSYISFNSITYAASESVTFSVFDFLGFGNPLNVKIFRSDSSGSSILPYGAVVQNILNAQLLKNLENIATTNALALTNIGLSASTINSLFTQLPATTKTATISVIGNPGAATCDPTIATAKGYTVIR